MNDKNINADSGENIGAEQELAPTSNEASDMADGAPKYEPNGKYERLIYFVYRKETLAEILRISSYTIVALTVYAFFMTVMALIESPIEIVKLLAAAGIPFVAVSALRILFDAPRPYELFEFYEKKPKGKAGKSFPSRHVFSVFVIAVLILPTYLAVGIGLMVLGALLAFLRVALGIHFVRDVVAGGLIGIVSGVIGLLILNLI